MFLLLVIFLVYNQREVTITSHSLQHCSQSSPSSKRGDSTLDLDSTYIHIYLDTYSITYIHTRGEKGVSSPCAYWRKLLPLPSSSPRVLLLKSTKPTRNKRKWKSIRLKNIICYYDANVLDHCIYFSIFKLFLSYLCQCLFLSSYTVCLRFFFLLLSPLNASPPFVVPSLLSI